MAGPAPQSPSADSGAAKNLRVLAVIVFHGEDAAQSSTLKALLASAEQVEQDLLSLRVLLFSNSSGVFLTPPGAPAWVTAQTGHGNEGLAGAYNAALRLAEQSGCHWLLTLDHDTELPTSFLPSIVRVLLEQQRNEKVAAVVPHLVEGERILSPSYVLFGRTRPLPLGFNGIPAREVRAYNSGAMLRVVAFRELGGFPQHFWLDYLDNVLHHELHRRGKSIYVVGSLVLQHRLSLLNYRERLTPERFRNFLFAESAYHDLYDSPLENLLHAVRLAGRLWRQWRRGDAPGIRAATWECLRSRLLRRRATRLQDWRGAMDSRLRASAAEPLLPAAAVGHHA